MFSQSTWELIRIALSLSESIWEHLEESVCLFKVAELFSCDLQTILHIADVLEIVKILVNLS